MALLWLDSFDNIGVHASNAALLTKYDASRSGSPIISSTQARTGTFSLRPTAAASVSLTTKPLGASGSTFFVGFAWFVDAAAWGTGPHSNGGIICRITQEDATVHLRLSIDASGHLLVYRNTTLLGTSTATLTFNTWYQLEFKGTIHDSTGSYEVRVDEIDILSATGVDTRNGGDGSWNRVEFWGSFATSGTYVDDLWILDGTGSVNNNFLGFQKVGSSHAVADSVSAGSNAQFTPSTGSDHGAMVDEAAANGDTDYNFSSTVGHIDSYRIQAVSLTGTTHGIQVNRYLKKTDAGAKTSRAVIRSGGTNFGQATQSPLTTYGYLSVISEADPASAAPWTKTALDAAEFGEEIVS